MKTGLYDLHRALKEQFGIRGDFAPELSESVVPVISIGDLNGAAAPYGIPWSVTGTAAAVAAQRSYVLIKALEAINGYSFRIDRARIQSQGASDTLVMMGRGAAQINPGTTSPAIITDTRRWVMNSSGNAGQAFLNIAQFGADTAGNIGSRAIEFWELTADGNEWEGPAWLHPDPLSNAGLFFALVQGTDNVALRASISGMAFGAR